MNSMTGYGKATVNLQGRELTVELKSVNHRFLDISTKIPRTFIAYEDIIRNCLSQGLSRGHIDVFVNYINNSDSDKVVEADIALAQNYVDVADKLAQSLQLNNDFSVMSLFKSPDVIKVQQRAEDEELLRQMLTQAMQLAIEKLNTMRSQEGQKLLLDITTRLDNVESLLNGVKKCAPTVVENYRTKLTARITEILSGVEVDQAKLMNEVAFFADKSNIDEEIARLDCHIANARKMLELNEPIGRKLDFLVQEFNREANTMCSKSNDLQLTNLALQLKNEIEKIREQVQNLE